MKWTEFRSWARGKACWVSTISCHPFKQLIKPSMSLVTFSTAMVIQLGLVSHEGNASVWPRLSSCRQLVVCHRQLDVNGTGWELLHAPPAGGARGQTGSNGQLSQGRKPVPSLLLSPAWSWATANLAFPFFQVGTLNGVLKYFFFQL